MSGRVQDECSVQRGDEQAALAGRQLHHGAAIVLWMQGYVAHHSLTELHVELNQPSGAEAAVHVLPVVTPLQAHHWQKALLLDAAFVGLEREMDMNYLVSMEVT